MLNFLGVGQNFSVLAETAWDTTFSFRDEVTGEVANLDAVTFEGWVMVKGSKRDMRFTRADMDGLRHLVAVAIPKLPEGRWEFEIFCATETGEKTRMVYGYVSAVGGMDSSGGTTYENRTLEVRLPGDATRRIQLEWQATTLAQLAAAEARKILKEIQEAKQKAEDAAAKLKELENAVKEAQEARDEAQEIVDNAPREFIPDISEDGYWVINGVKTTKRAVAKDGVNGADGVTVVRHSIADESELPTEGETCSGGHLYYVVKQNEPASAVLTLREGVTLADLPESLELVVNGTTVRASAETLLTIDGLPGLLLEAITAAIEGVTGEVRDGALCLTTEADTLTVDAEAQGLFVVEETPCHRWESSPCYAWCLDSEGAGEWVLISADGMMTAGSGGSGNVYIGSGGWTMEEATADTLGTVRLGTDEVFFEETSPVGKDASGRLCVDVGRTLGTATFTEFGVVKLGSEFNVKNNIPYLLSITADRSGKLCQNLAAGGALKHMQRAGWVASGTLGVDFGSMPGNDYFMGLHTSPSFQQSEDKGLELKDATEEQIGGVTLATGFDDPEPAHVLDAAGLRLACYSKIQTEKRLENYIETNTTLMKIKIMTAEEYDALAQIDAHTLYLVY